MMKVRFGASLSAFALAALMGLAPTPTRAQSAEPAAPIAKQLGPADLIMPHITDSKSIEVPCFKSVEEWSCEWELPTWPVTIGGKTYDLGPTKHVVFLWLSALICLVLLIGVARRHARSSRQIGRPTGFAAGV